MKFPSPLKALCHCLSFLFVFCVLTVPPALGDDWRPITRELLEDKSPVVEKDADAEAVFWEVRVDDQNDGSPNSVFSHYVRVKVYTERGVESQNKIDIPYFNRTSVKDINGRTIKADSSIIELKKDAVFERTLVRASGLKIKAKSFVMPGVEPGAVIEYRWKEVRPTYFYTRLQMQREIPVREVKYYVKPMEHYLYTMRSISFRANTAAFAKEKNGYYSTGMTNVPAFREEPHMPPEDQVRSWILLYYSEDRKLTAEKYWKDYGKRLYDEYKSAIKPNDEVRRVAGEAVAGATTDDEKLHKLFDYCRANIKNVLDDAAGVTPDELRKMKENKSPGDTLKRREGTGRDIDLLFAAMANAIGFEARVTALSDRSDIFFDPQLSDDYFLSTYNIAVKVGGAWRFFDPGSTYVPFGMLRWQEEGQQALVSDPKEPFFLQTPLSEAAKSSRRRTAKLQLTEDGTLEGEVRVEYTGHVAAEHKELNDEDSATAREQAVVDQLRARMSTGEVSEVRMENVVDPVKPFVYAYRVSVPGYAQRTGKRLFLQPAFFQFGVGNLFATSERRHALYFRYPWSEEDDVSITLPAGFALDHAESPASFKISETSHYTVQLGITKDQSTLKYRRKFVFGGFLYAVDQYPQIKRIFDVIHEQDNHKITLKQGVATATSNKQE